MQVQFLIDKKSAGADHVVGWTVLKPGASHEQHLHRNCDEFFIVLKGHGHIITDKGLEPSGEGDVVYSPRGCWHGFNNTSDEDVVLVWGWMGAGSIEDSGYEKNPPGRTPTEMSATLRRSAHCRRPRARRWICASAASARAHARSAGRSASARRPRCEAQAHRTAGGLHPGPRHAGVGLKVSLSGWQKPAAEAEIAAHIGRDLLAQANRDDVRAAVAAIGPAIELADIDKLDGGRRGRAGGRHLPAPRHPRPARHHAPGCARLQGSEEAASPAAGRTCRCRPTCRPTSATSSTSCAMWRMSRPTTGDRLRAGQFVICGSLTAPMLLSRPADTGIDYALEPNSAPISVKFSG